jgi:hypothetical protein
MDSHLQLLKEFFPGKLYLNVDDIAKLKNVSRGHIYNLCTDSKQQNKPLPFNLTKDKVTGRPVVSILSLAKYMDSEVARENEQREKAVDEMISKPPKKKGRPRNSQRNILAFRHDMSMAVLHLEIEETFGSLQDKIESIQFQDNQKSCSEKIDDCKLEFSNFTIQAKSSVLYSFLQLALPDSPIMKIRNINKI